MRSTIALSAWHDPVAAVVLRAKLRGRREVFAALGPLLADAVRGAGWRGDCIVPVPTARRAVRQRGADHTRELGRTLAGALGLPVVPALRVGRAGTDRGRAPSEQRPSVAVDAFAPTRRVTDLHGRRALLVDDVLTTGGTAHAAASVLGRHGAVAVDLAVVARAGTHVLGR